MPKFSVLFDVRYFNGCMHVFAENAEKAQEMVENEDLDKLRCNCGDMAVEVENVSLAIYCPDQFKEEAKELKEPANESDTD